MRKIEELFARRTRLRECILMNPGLHARTPNLTVIDSRGLPIRQVAYLRNLVGGPLDTLITRQRHDAAGRLLEQTDPRFFGLAPNLYTSTAFRRTADGRFRRCRLAPEPGRAGR